MVLNSCNLCKSGRNNSWKNSSSIYSQAIFLTQKRSHCQLKMLLLSSLKRNETGNMAGKRHSNIIQRKEISVKHFLAKNIFSVCCCLYTFSHTLSQTENVECHINMTSKSRGISITAFGWNIKVFGVFPETTRC